MREIEFRAKSIDKDQWNYGYYVERAEGKHQLVTREKTFPVLVQSGTVGQFTGLLDKNGVKIWEGDKFQDVFSDNIGVVKFGSYHHCFDDKRLIEFGAHVGFYVDFENGSIRKDLDYWVKNREVIGNIHDTPDLLTPQASKEGGEKI